jgi:bifunctional DNA-binding transcriptional regulator/antitoxin component of YhaV-PrlF toxin-antitoxin module
MALRLKVCDEDSIAIPRSILERLLLKEGDRIEVTVDANRLILQGVADKLAALKCFRGIWKDEDVDKVFRGIDEEWDRWNERLHA